LNYSLVPLLASFSSKQAIKIKAGFNSEFRVVSSKEYTSNHFGENPPKPFDTFDLPLEFVVLQSIEGEIVSEDFYTFLGASTKADYQDGKFKNYSSAAWNSPVYLCTVLIPVLVGCFSFLIPFIGKTFIPLLYSGVIWTLLSSTIYTLFAMFTQPLNGVE
jgi:hypothetical protein